MYKLSLIQNPSGSWSFVGSVPAKLAYVTKAGNYASEAEIAANLRLPASRRTIKDRTFSCPDDAWREARALGYCK